MDYVILTPVEGKTHAPSNPAHAWKYPYDSQMRSIFASDGVSPRPIVDLGEAAHAVSYFTRRGEHGATEELVTMDVKQGAVDTVARAETAPQVFACSVPGCDFVAGDYATIAKHIPECATKDLPTGVKDRPVSRQPAKD